MAQAQNSTQLNAYNGALGTGQGVIYDQLGNPRVVGAQMTSGAGNGKVLTSDASGNLTLQSVGGAAGALLAANNLSDVASTSASFANISPLTTPGDLIIESGSTAPARLAVGAAGQSLQVSAGLPSWQPGMVLLASTGTAGTALQNATPTIISWTVPTDGNMHRFQVFGGVVTASTETGGAIGVSYKYPDGSSTSDTLDAGSHAAGHNLFTPRLALVQSGATVSVNQTSALTGGTATTWAELWGS